MNTKYKHLLFDADNTLLDFNLSEHHVIRKTLTEFNIKDQEKAIEYYRQISKEIWTELEAGKITMDKLKIDRFSRLIDKMESNANPKEMGEFFLYTLSESEKTIDGALELCKNLSRNYKLYIASNGFYEVQIRRVQVSGLKPYINDYFISEEIGHSKPDSRFFLKIIDRINPDSKDELLMIGDSETSDIRGASNVGIDSVYFNPGGYKSSIATYNIENLTDIYNLLEVI